VIELSNWFPKAWKSLWNHISRVLKEWGIRRGVIYQLEEV
jgi:hypothetical protein